MILQFNDVNSSFFLIHFDLFQQEWSVAASIFNINKLGLAHCLPWVKLS